MISIRKTLLDDFRRIQPNPERTAFLTGRLLEHGVDVLMHSMGTMTGINILGQPIIIADAFPYLDGMYVWAIMDEDLPKYFRYIVRALLHSMKFFEGETLYAHAEHTHIEGARLLQFLGLTMVKPNDVRYGSYVFDLYKRLP